MHKEKIKNILENIVCSVEAEVAKGICNVDTHELGAAIDMIKDLCVAEEKAYKACHYKKLLEEMEEDEKFEEGMLRAMIKEQGEIEGRAGYDRWRTSRGRFARKGTGHETSMAEATGRSGFTPDMPWPNPPYYDDPKLWAHEPWMAAAGYDRNLPRSHDGRTSGSSYEQHHTTGRMGYTPDPNMMRGQVSDRGARYDGYDEARRHFHETGSQEHKQRMTDQAKEYVGESLETMRDIFAEADPDLQKKMRDDLSRLYREFGGK